MGTLLTTMFGEICWIVVIATQINSTKIIVAGASKSVMSGKRITNNGPKIWGHGRRAILWSGRTMILDTIKKIANGQQRNRRNNIYVIIEGVKYLAIELSERSGIKTDTIVERADRGLTLEEVLSEKRYFNLEGFKLGPAISAKKRLDKTHCKNGHEFTPENTRIEGNGKYTWRCCKTCHRERHRK
jgi:hypothetical protein